MQRELDPRGQAAPRHDPYRFWLSGILVEVGTFVAFSLALLAMTALIVLIVGN